MNPEMYSTKSACDPVQKDTVSNKIERMINKANETNEVLKAANHSLDGSGENTVACEPSQGPRCIEALLCNLERILDETNKHAHSINMAL